MAKNQPKKRNPFPYTAGFKRYHTYDFALRQRFGGKVARISLDGGFTCPNRDGTLGTGGCAFCSGRGSGDLCADRFLPIEAQYRLQRAVAEKKWGSTKYLPYFQAFSGTYAPIERLRELYERALALPGACGLIVATRPDCLSAEALSYLAELKGRTYLCVELGLQSAHEKTMRRMGRGHDTAAFLRGYEALQKRDIFTAVHLINGLPGESAEDMLQSARFVAALQPHGVKFHMLQILRSTRLAELYEKEPFALLDLPEYIEIVCRQIECLPPRTVVMRLCSDSAPGLCLSPLWPQKKFVVQNEADKWFLRHDAYQGKAWEE